MWEREGDRLDGGTKSSLITACTDSAAAPAASVASDKIPQ